LYNVHKKQCLPVSALSNYTQMPAAPLLHRFSSVICSNTCGGNTSPSKNDWIVCSIPLTYCKESLRPLLQFSLVCWLSLTCYHIWFRYTVNIMWWWLTSARRVFCFQYQLMGQWPSLLPKSRFNGLLSLSFSPPLRVWISQGNNFIFVPFFFNFYIVLYLGSNFICTL
jgi:hypothetical protein